MTEEGKASEEIRSGSVLKEADEVYSFHAAKPKMALEHYPT
jgi:hypothetical protein